MQIFPSTTTPGGLYPLRRLSLLIAGLYTSVAGTGQVSLFLRATETQYNLILEALPRGVGDASADLAEWSSEYAIAIEAATTAEAAATVAAAADVSKGGLLYHFPSKDALVEGMLDRLRTRGAEEQRDEQTCADGQAHRGPTMRQLVSVTGAGEKLVPAVMVSMLAGEFSGGRCPCGGRHRLARDARAPAVGALAP